MSDDHVKMREFMEIALSYSNEAQQPELLEEEVIPFPSPRVIEEHPLLSDLRNLVSTLRGHMEDDDNQERAVGVEMGMNRAADMIENLLRRQSGEERVG
jgi:hypothetical protein